MTAMIATIGLVVALAVIGVMVRAIWRGDEPPVRMIPSPHGPLPEPTDEELRAAWNEHPPEHGYQRLDGDRWCTDCGWTPDDQWFVPVERESGHKVTGEPRHNCPTEG